MLKKSDYIDEYGRTKPAFELLSEDEQDSLFRPVARNNPKTLLPLYIFLILQNHSSIRNPLSQKDIMLLLDRKYELMVERKSLSRHIHLLADAGLGIHCERVGCWYNKDDVWDEERPDLYAA